MTSLRTNQPEEPKALVSWKEIASYLNRAERTVKRWERERELPVHRVPGGERGRVFAYPWELKAWLDSGRQTDATVEEDESEAEGAEPDSEKPSTPVEGDVTPLSGGGAERSVRSKTSRHWISWAAAGVVLAFFAGSGMLIFGHHRSHAHEKALTVAVVSGAPTHIPNARAEQFYLQGRYQWGLRTADSLTKSVDDYTQAIVADPDNAQAYAALAESYELLPDFGQAGRVEAYARAKAAADRAIALEPALPAGHRAKAFVLFFGDWDIPASDSEYQKALALDPNQADTHHWYADSLLSRLEGVKSIEQIDEALRLSPTSPAIVADSAFIHGFFHDHRQANTRTLRDLVRTQPNLVMSSRYLANFDLEDGNYSAYVADLWSAAAISHDPDETALAQDAEQGWVRGGKAGMLEGMRQAQQAAFDRGTASGYRLGRTYLLLGQPKAALHYFRAALERNDFTLMTLSGCECIAGLKSDPEYVSFLSQIRARMHLPAPGQVGLAEARKP